MKLLQEAGRRSLAIPGRLQHFFDIPIRNVAGISLVEAILELATELLLDHATKLIAINEHVNSLRTVVQHLDWTTPAVLNCLTLFF